MKKLLLFALLLGGVLSADLHAVIINPFLSPLTTFGGGDGWLAPGDRTYLTTGDHQSSLAFNPATGNLILVNRSGGLSLPILNSTTGAQITTLSTAGVFQAGSAIRPLHMIAAAADGRIYGANLADTSITECFVYEWANEASGAFLSYRRDQAPARMGDSMDVTTLGGFNHILVSAAPGTGGGTHNGYFTFTTSGGAPFSIHLHQFPSNPPAPGDHRLGLTYLGPGRVLGTQGGVARLSTLTYEQEYLNPLSSFTTSVALAAATERPMDFAVVGGTPVLATLDTAKSLVRLYDFTNPSSPLLLDARTNIIGAGNPNAAGVGEVQFGNIVGNTATLYALNANNGIQAFVVTVPEPATLSLLAAASLAIFRRRRQRAQ